MREKNATKEKSEDYFETNVSKIKSIMAQKRKRLHDKIKRENEIKMKMLNEEKKMLLKELNRKELEMNVIREKEEIQLNEIDEEIINEENDYINALKEKIEIGRIFDNSNAKKRNPNE